METSARAERAQKRKEKEKKKRVRALVIALCVVLVLASAALFYLYYSGQVRNEEDRQRIINSGTFHNGITVAGIDVSGMTMNDAKAALAPVEEDLKSGVYFDFVCGTDSFHADSSCFTITFDTEAVLSEALLLGREGNLIELQQELADIKTNGRSYDISYTVEPTGVESFIHSFADQMAVSPTDATFAVKQLATNTDTKALDAINIGPPEDATDTDLRDLRFDFTEAVDGSGVDMNALMEQVKARAESRDFGEIGFELTSIPANVTIATIKENLVLRSQGETSYRSNRSNSNRVFNLKKAAGKVYGTVLQPGEEFSANTILGDRTEKTGWLMAPAIIGGGIGHEDQPGGGVCQIATTTYHAVLRGDFEVVYRRAHSTKSGYTDGGLDATINTGTIDFQWKNNTENPVYVFTWVNTKDYTVHCEIYGQPFPDTFDRIEISSKKTGVIEPTAPEFTENAALAAPYWILINNSKPGLQYQSYATYYKGDTVVETKEITLSTYNMHPTRYYVWPGYAGESLNPAFQLVLSEDGTTYIIPSTQTNLAQ